VEFTKRYSFRDLILIPILIGAIIGFFNLTLLISTNSVFNYILNNVLVFDESLLPLKAFKKPENFVLTLSFGGLLIGLLKGFLLGKKWTTRGIANLAVASFHRDYDVSFKVFTVFMFSTFITVGLGGSVGLLAPAGFAGFFFAQKISNAFNVSTEAKLKLLASGFGAGASSLFGTPLAGIFIAAEAFYRFDYEPGVLVPASISSIVAYLIVSQYVGYEPRFFINVSPFNLNLERVFIFTVFGVFLGICVRIYVLLLNWLKDFFQRLTVYPFLKPFLGAFFASSLIFITPVVVGRGDLWINLQLENKLNELSLLGISALALMLSSSLLLASGNGGGIFMPSLTTGFFLGSFFAEFLNKHLGLNVNGMVFSLIGMSVTFGTGAKMPLATLLLVIELTKGYHVIVPTLISLSIAYVITGEGSFLTAQVSRRIYSPVHLREIKRYLKERLKT